MVTLHRDDVDQRWYSRLPAAYLPYNWAHPWPTWSRLSGEHVDDRWNVQAAVPLRAVFVVDQAAQDRATPDELRTFHARRFENLCAMVRAIPVYLLDVSLDGAFWKEIEQVIR